MGTKKHRRENSNKVLSHKEKNKKTKGLSQSHGNHWNWYNDQKSSSHCFSLLRECMRKQRCWNIITQLGSRWRSSLSGGSVSTGMRGRFFQVNLHGRPENWGLIWSVTHRGNVELIRLHNVGRQQKCSDSHFSG